MKRQLLVFASLAALAFSGCTVYRIDSKDTSEEYYSPKTSIDDVAYVETVDKPYTEIGTVTVTTQRNLPMNDVLPKLKQEAGMLGADAITDVKGDAPDMWKQLPGQKIIGNSYVLATYTAKALVWK